MNIILKHYQKCLARFSALVKQDLQPRKVAQAVAWGFFLGIIPFFFALNIFLSIIVSWRFKLNHVLVQLVNNIIYPLQLLLFVPFIRIGVSWFSDKEMTFSTQLILAAFRESVWGGLILLGSWNLYGLLAWCIIAGPISIIGYFVGLKIFRYSAQKIRKVTNTCDEVLMDVPAAISSELIAFVPEDELVESY